MKSDKIKSFDQATRDHEDLRVPDSGYIPNEGEYHMVALDRSGKEIYGSDFSIPPKDYARTYQHRTSQFKVKKNPNQ